MPLNDQNPLTKQIESLANKIYQQKVILSGLFNKNIYNTNPEDLIDLDIQIALEEDLLSQLQTDYYSILKNYTSTENNNLKQ